LEGTTLGLQGFGNVAQHAAKMFTELGGRVAAISCWDNGDKMSYTYRKKDGIVMDKLLSITDSFGCINKKKATDAGCEVLPGDEWIAQDVDILMPAALENQITPKNVNKISKQVKILLEGANGPTTPDADEILRKRGIFLLPDFLANAGGVTCSYFEQVQSNSNYYWEKEEVLEKLNTKMTSAYRAVHELAERKNLYMRDAAYIIAINRVAQAVKMRGWA